MGKMSRGLEFPWGIERRQRTAEGKGRDLGRHSKHQERTGKTNCFHFSSVLKASSTDEGEGYQRKKGGLWGGK